MTEEIEVLLDVAARLDQVGIAYMVTGSMALNFYTRPRMTRDIDVVIELRAEDVDSLEDAFKQTYMVDKASVLRALDGAPRMFNIIHEEMVMKIDFIIRKDSPYRREEFQRRTYEDFFGTSVAVVAPEDLVLSKLDWARVSRSELQLGDVKSLLSNVSDLDISYIDRWAAELGLENLWREVAG